MIKSAQSKLSLVTLRAFTLIELMIVVAVLGILYAVTLWALQPDILKQKSRDVLRISDIGKLQSTIENYITDNGVPPDLSNVLRQSNTAASPSASPNLANGNGWIGVDLRQYLDKLATDPINNGGFVYRYKRVGINYELDAKLEYETNLMANSGSEGDGGNSNTHYEKGTDLTILGD